MIFWKVISQVWSEIKQIVNWSCDFQKIVLPIIFGKKGLIWRFVVIENLNLSYSMKKSQKNWDFSPPGCNIKNCLGVTLSTHHTNLHAKFQVSSMSGMGYRVTWVLRIDLASLKRKKPVEKFYFLANMADAPFGLARRLACQDSGLYGS